MVYEYQKNAAGHFVCNICGATKEHQNTMHYHLKRHEGHLPFKCSHCDKEFLHANTLALHISARHAKATAAALPCPCCPHRTLTKANRVIHYLRKHCPEDVARFQTQLLTCGACKKQCNSSTAFLYHIAAKCLPLPDDKRKQLNALLA